MAIAKVCPYCGSKLVGQKGNRVCSRGVACGAYEVDTSNPKSYDRPLSKQERKEKFNSPSS